MNEEISRQLREAAEAHQPDRGRMLARVERGMATATVRRRTPGIARSWPKATLVGFAVTGVLAVAGVAAAVVIPTVPPPSDTASTLTVPRPSDTSASTPSAPPAVSTAPPAATSGEDRSTPVNPNPNPNPAAGSKLTDGPLSSKGSIDPHSHAFWSQSNLTLDTTKPLTALTVQLHFTLTGGVQDTGKWQTGPADDFTVTVQETDGVLVYRWDLKPGRSVPAGQHVFAAQYNHTAGPHNGTDDKYGVLATADDGSHAVWGGFVAVK